MQLIDQMTIIGTGLLGTSLGLAVRQRGLVGRVVGVGRNEVTLGRAKARGGFDAVTTDYLEGLSEAQLVVIALPLGCFEEAFAKIAIHAAADAVVTDVGSAKRSVVTAAHRGLGGQRAPRFVGSHPMAGSELAGPDAARGELFQRKPCILTLEATTDPDAADMVERLWICVGMRVLRMDPEQHDRFVAAVSHVPHLAAGLLVALAGKLGGLEIASTGFASATRLASGSPEIWRDIVTANREPIAEALRELSSDAATLAKLVEQGSSDAIEQWLDKQKQARDTWVSKQNQ